MNKCTSDGNYITFLVKLVQDKNTENNQLSALLDEFEVYRKSNTFSPIKVVRFIKPVILNQTSHTDYFSWKQMIVFEAMSVSTTNV